MSFVYAVIRKMCPPLAASDYKTSVAKNPHQANCNAGRLEMLLLDGWNCTKSQIWDDLQFNSLKKHAMFVLFLAITESKVQFKTP